MPKFAANLSMLYTEYPFIERFAAAAADGFKAVEYVSPYEEVPGAIAAQLKRHGLAQALFNLPAGNWAAGERGIACLPDRIAEFEVSVGKAITYAEALACRKINCLAGIAPACLQPDVAEATLVSNLRHAAQRLAMRGYRWFSSRSTPATSPDMS
jgi:hydroxypyruvate isomerase